MCISEIAYRVCRCQRQPGEIVRSGRAGVSGSGQHSNGIECGSFGKEASAGNYQGAISPVPANTCGKMQSKIQKGKKYVIK